MLISKRQAHIKRLTLYIYVNHFVTPPLGGGNVNVKVRLTLT